MASEQPSNKRGRYVSQACLECQKRKTKCSGEDECEQCRLADLTCAYAPGPARKRRATTNATNAASATNATTSASTTSTASASAWQSEVTDRLGRLEVLLHRTAGLQREQLRHQAAGAGLPTPLSTPKQSNNQDVLDTTEATLQQPINALNHLVKVNSRDAADHDDAAAVDATGPESMTSPPPPAPRCTAAECTTYPQCCQPFLRMWDPPTRAADSQWVLDNVNGYFETIDPHYPCLDRTQIQQQLRLSLAVDEELFTSNNTLQFSALIYLMIAAYRVNNEPHERGALLPGWQQFLCAVHLLDHATWLGRGNLLTIQCLVVQTLFLIYTEKFNVAYDTVSKIARLCYQLGLTRQRTWTNCTPWEAHMRQRLVWSVYCLDRYVAQIWGAPYVMREADITVQLPSLHRELNAATSATSPNGTPAPSLSYLHFMTQWARLSSDIWDAVFSANAPSPPSPQVLATMDARIMLLEHELPAHLQWSDGTSHESVEQNSSPVPHHVLRQRLLLRLRTNHLRLLMRRESLLRPDCSERNAQTCLDVAKDMVTVIHSSQKSHVGRTSDRHATTLYLTSALVSLGSIVLRYGPTPRGYTAAEFFDKAMGLVKEAADTYTFARITVSRLDKVAKAVERATMDACPVAPPEPRRDSMVQSVQLRETSQSNDMNFDFPAVNDQNATGFQPASLDSFLDMSNFLGGGIWETDWLRTQTPAAMN